MYRVELKDTHEETHLACLTPVPNVPCGVESCGWASSFAMPAVVPNVPCGVERGNLPHPLQGRGWFLMYRVELKERQHTIREQRLPVFGKERRNFWCKYFLRGKYHAEA